MDEGGRDAWQTLWTRFDALVDLPEAERAEALAALAAQSPALAAELRALLAADGRDQGPLEAALRPAGTEADQGWSLAAGACIGPWRLLGPLGRGGMGEVWLAERQDGAYQRQVALKLLKRGLDTEAIVRRFRQERQILARLDHPGIVRIVDGGVAEDGRPWFAMDRVDGEPLLAHAAGRRLDLRARVALVAQVADAVAFAHARLVVHRDLKPANIVVGADGRPRLLDFGIAKLLEETGEQTLTGTGLRLMSPAYAAPEQIRGEPVGTATDVYALGLVLCELVTGQLPHQRRAPGVEALVRGLDTETAQRASTLLGQVPEATLAAQYGEGGDRRRLLRQVAGDLDLIIATAVRPDPAARYATAAAFAEDLRRWLDGRAIAARPESVRARVRGFVRRHRTMVAATALAFAALLAGLAAALWQADQARQQARRAELSRDFLLSLFAEQDPVARASLQARSPSELVADGIDRARRSLVDDAALRLDVLGDLAALQARLGDGATAAPLLRELLDERRTVDGEDTPAVAQLQVALAGALGGADAPQALAEAKAAVATLERTLGPDHPATARARDQLARALLLTGAADDALEHLRRAHAALAATLGADHEETLQVQVSLAVTLENLDRLDEAEAQFLAALAGIRRSAGEQHARLVRPLTVLADVRRRQQRYPEAAALMAEAAVLARQVLPARHPMVGQLLMRQGDLLRRTGDLDGAGAALAEAGAQLPGTGGAAAQLAMFEGALARARGDPAGAATAFERSQSLFLAALGADSVYPWSAAIEHGNALLDLGRLDQARAQLEAALARLLAIAGPDSYDVASATAALARVQAAQGRHAEAAQGFLRAHQGFLAIYGARHASTLEAGLGAARALRLAGDAAGARAALDALALPAPVPASGGREGGAPPGAEPLPADLSARIALERAYAAQAAGAPEQARTLAAAALADWPEAAPGDAVRSELRALAGLPAPR